MMFIVVQNANREMRDKAVRENKCFSHFAGFPSTLRKQDMRNRTSQRWQTDVDYRSEIFYNDAL